VEEGLGSARALSSPFFALGALKEETKPVVASLREARSAQQNG